MGSGILCHCSATERRELEEDGVENGEGAHHWPEDVDAFPGISGVQPTAEQHLAPCPQRWLSYVGCLLEICGPAARTRLVKGL